MSSPEWQQGYNEGFQAGLLAAQSAQPGSGTGYPVDLVVAYPERSSRVLMFFFIFKPLLLIPHLFVLWFLSIGAFFVTFAAWWAVVITGRFPRSLWDFLLGCSRWQIRVNTYMSGLTDKYPPFSLDR